MRKVDGIPEDNICSIKRFLIDKVVELCPARFRERVHMVVDFVGSVAQDPHIPLPVGIVLRRTIICSLHDTVALIGTLLTDDIGGSKELAVQFHLKRDGHINDLEVELMCYRT